MLDWAVFHFPSSKIKNRKKSAAHIKKINKLGKLKGTKQQAGSLVFFNGSGTEYRPNLFGQCHAKGDGWRVDIDLTNLKQDSVNLTLHLAKRSSNIRLQLYTEDQKILSSRDLTDSSPYAAYAFSYVLDLSSLKKPKSVFFKITYLEFEKNKNAGIALNALTLQ